MELKQQIGGIIHNVRTEKGMSLKLLAKMSHTQESHLCKIEHGTMNPTIETIDDIFNQLGIQIEFKIV